MAFFSYFFSHLDIKSTGNWKKFIYIFIMELIFFSRDKNLLRRIIFTSTINRYYISFLIHEIMIAIRWMVVMKWLLCISYSISLGLTYLACKSLFVGSKYKFVFSLYHHHHLSTSDYFYYFFFSFRPHCTFVVGRLAKASLICNASIEKLIIYSVGAVKNEAKTDWSQTINNGNYWPY